MNKKLTLILGTLAVVTVSLCFVYMNEPQSSTLLAQQQTAPPKYTKKTKKPVKKTAKKRLQKTKKIQAKKTKLN